jgi:hypothetical protein
VGEKAPVECQETGVSRTKKADRRAGGTKRWEWPMVSLEVAGVGDELLGAGSLNAVFGYQGCKEGSQGRGVR